MEKIIKEEKEKALGSKKIVSLVIRYFRVIPPVLLLLILIIGYQFLIKPKITKVNEQVAVGIEERLVAYEKSLVELDELSELKRAYQKIKPEDIERLNIMLPDKVEIEKMLIRMESYIKGEGFILHSLEISESSSKAKGGKKGKDKAAKGLSIPKEPAPFSPLPSEIGIMTIKVEMSGLDAGIDNYETFKRFLRIIEGNLKLFDLDKVDYSPGKDSITVNLITYFSNL